MPPDPVLYNPMSDDPMSDDPMPVVSIPGTRTHAVLPRTRESRVAGGSGRGSWTPAFARER